MPCTGCALNQLAPNNTERHHYSDLPVCLLVAEKASIAIIPFTFLSCSHSAPKFLGCSIGLLQDFYLPHFPISVDYALISPPLSRPFLDSSIDLLEQVYTPKVDLGLVLLFEFYTDDSVKDYGFSSCHAESSSAPSSHMAQANLLATSLTVELSQFQLDWSHMKSDLFGMFFNDLLLDDAVASSFKSLFGIFNLLKTLYLSHFNFLRFFLHDIDWALSFRALNFLFLGTLCTTREADSRVSN
ncbi:hypothetical protein RclHR1_08240020 [Rhizophagus clarus]|uniref:Uncharacterized protein n=1 Tax=Rhizophagus clarus TaxID=94130 RepID=A0A2Z6SEL8_9GLOM|nr:hypothetical protein RclHR1_08240020 [Rhizophagus clarus]